MPEPAERLGFYLTHSFTGHSQLFTNLFEGIPFAIYQSSQPRTDLPIEGEL